MGDTFAPRPGTGPPVAIAPAPVRSSSNGNITPDDTPQPIMSYACQTCTRRKVKCDKLTPMCSSCSKGKLECIYQAPPPRKRKRKPSGDASNEKLAQYEQILHQHGLLPQAPTEMEPMVLPTPLANRAAIADLAATQAKKNEPARVGKLLAGPGKSRYVDSQLWRNLGVDEMMRMSDDEDDEDGGPLPANGMDQMQLDPFSGALLGISQSLTDYHPSHSDAIRLWQTHKENVEPICKVLHIPTVNAMVQSVSQQPALASKADEVLLFAIYHFAVVSMDADDCLLNFGQTREDMMKKYSYAIRQALVNAQVLKTTEMQVLQAYLLWLISIKNFNDPHTYWMLTGMLVRIAQRMGLHRDGEAMGLPPFQVQMRRRLFYQVIPLDGYASQVSGTGISIGLDTWDTKQPANINDDDIWPDMTEPPEPREGATDMIFCLTRAEVGKHMAMAMRVSKSDASWDWKDDPKAISKMVDDAEASVETKFLRYCDIITPLHYLTLGMARAALHGLRLRARLPKMRTSGATDEERREVFHLAMRVMVSSVSILQMKRLSPHHIANNLRSRTLTQQPTPTPPSRDSSGTSAPSSTGMPWSASSSPCAT